MLGLPGSRVALESQTHMGILACVIHQKRVWQIVQRLGTPSCTHSRHYSITKIPVRISAIIPDCSRKDRPFLCWA